MIMGQIITIFHHESEKLTPESTLRKLRETERVEPDPLLLEEDAKSVYELHFV